VYIHHHQSPLQSLFLQKQHHFFRTHGGESRSGFIHKQYGGFPDEFQRYIQAFALSAADVLLQGISNLQMFYIFKIQVGQDLIHLSDYLLL